MNMLKVATTASKALPVPVEIILMVIVYAIGLIFEKSIPQSQVISDTASKFKMDEKIVSQIFKFIK